MLKKHAVIKISVAPMTSSPFLNCYHLPTSMFLYWTSLGSGAAYISFLLNSSLSRRMLARMGFSLIYF